MSQYFENDENIKSEIKRLSFSYEKFNFDFYSDNGVFSKNEIDYGSRLLIDTFIKNYNGGKRILDVGGGIGVISIVLSRTLNCYCTMVEVNERAIELSKKNIDINKLEDYVEVIKSDVYENINNKYDVIITNPPIRAGKKVVYRILLDSLNYLNDNGELWFVMRKNHGALSAKRDVESVFGNCDIVKKDKGFFILKSVKNN